MQQFSNLDYYDPDDDLDYIRHHPSSKKPYYEGETKHFYFLYQDADGEYYQLSTTVSCYWKVTPGSYDYDAASDWDYLGYTDLVDWKVISVEDAGGSKVEPKDVLTEKQLLEYTANLEDFVGVKHEDNQPSTRILC